MLWPQRHLSPTPVGVGVGTSLIWAIDQTLLPARVWLRETTPCRGTIFGVVGRIQSGGAHAGRTALTIESSLMSGCGWGHEPKEIICVKEALAQVSSASSKQNSKYGPNKVSIA